MGGSASEKFSAFFPRNLFLINVIAFAGVHNIFSIFQVIKKLFLQMFSPAYLNMRIKSK